MLDIVVIFHSTSITVDLSDYLSDTLYHVIYSILCHIVIHYILRERE